MEDGGLDSSTMERERVSSTSQPQDCEQMARRGKRPRNKVKKKDEEVKLLIPAEPSLQLQLQNHTAQKVGAWTKHDEITILNALINLKGIKSKRVDYAALYESIKQSLHRQSATHLDLQKKIKCLKEKYKRTRTPSVPDEEELFYLSHRVWGEVNKDHDIKQQFTCQSTSSSIGFFESLDPLASDKIFVGDLGLVLTTISRNHSNPLQVALHQYKLVSQSLSIRKSHGNQILEARITPKKEEHSELEEQKIARSYFNMKIQHAQLVSDAYNASHGFGNTVINMATDCVIKEDAPKVMNESNGPQTTIVCWKPITGKPSDTIPKSVKEMCHSQKRKKKRKRKIKNQEKHCDSSIQSQLEMENRSAVADSKDINESATSTQMHTLPDGLAIEVLVKGKSDGKVASPGKQVKINFIAKLRDTGCTVGSTIGAAPHQFRLGYEKVLKGLNIGIEGMHVGEKRRLTIPPSLGPGSKAKPPILPDTWLLYEVELVDICE